MTVLSKIKQICFYFPYMEDSGVPVLFYRMANALAKKHPELNIAVIDFEDGVMARNLIALPNTKVIPFKPDEEVLLPDDSILIMQSFIPYHWPVELMNLGTTKLFFWNLHPKNFVPSLLPIPSLRDFTFNNFFAYRVLSWFFPSTLKNLRNFVKLFIQHKAICFMDETNFETTKKYLFLADFNKQYLPVPVSLAQSLSTKTKNSKQYNFCWIGRICDFKSYIMVYTANKLAHIAKKNQVNTQYFVVGDGPFIAYVKEHISENEFFKVVYKGGMPHAKLDEFLIREIDVVTAMGTSALEGAKLKIPTILLDFSYQEINGDYVFRNLYDTINYDLGHAISKRDEVANNQSLEHIYQNIILDYEKEAEKAYQYYLDNHTIESVSSKFMQLINESDLTFQQVDKKLLAKPKILKFYYKLTHTKS